jgi:hypothetical protein
MVGSVFCINRWCNAIHDDHFTHCLFCGSPLRDDPCDDISDHPQWARQAPTFLTDDEASRRSRLFYDLRQQQRLRFEWWEIPLFVVCAMAIGAAVFSAWRAAVGS